MVVGIALLIVGSLGTIGLAALLSASTSEGTIELGSLATLSPRTAALVTAGVALGAAVVLAAGVLAVRRDRSHRARVSDQDERARAAEEEARARLLELRLAQLEHEVEHLELRRAAALGELQVPPPGEDEPRLVLVPDVGEATELSRRLASAPRGRRD